MEIDIVNKVLEILNANIENADLTLDQMELDLSAQGMDSIAFIHIIVILEEQFGIEFPDEKMIITEMNTVSKIVNVLSDVMKEENENHSNDCIE